ncbi:TetR/AcrR family transcriptional regulator [Desertihabitans brevis]|uniref:TetR/AcrR family transcriptional regulator n=1 Tax=Desertihabitans brevis TaxID=2268447 RepID=A0A367YXE9_9ACTN|nr:TetR/AcrR family transcriptional regulator [Desertihabitans brevis]RCK70508.1 TetR/AcrR family transcriptional regulator [Desertihabitans brevis]
MARAYDRTRRDEQAQQTRHRVLQAAERLLVDHGMPGFTVAALATAAGVSPQTVYNTVGGKADVVKALYDVRLAGDDEPVPMSRRPAFRAMEHSPDTRALLEAYVAITAGIHSRVGSLLGQLFAARGDPVVTGFVATIDRERRVGNGHAVDLLQRRHGLPAGLDREVAVDVVWTLTSPEVADRLLRTCDWPLERYRHWLLESLLASLGPRART